MKYRSLRLAVAMSTLFLPLGFVEKTEYDRVIQENEMLERKNAVLEEKVETLEKEKQEMQKEIDTIKTSR